MNAQILQIISIVTFSLGGVLAVVSVFLFFWMDIRGVWDDLSGKTQERQIRELREGRRELQQEKKSEISHRRKAEGLVSGESFVKTDARVNEDEEATSMLSYETEEETSLLFQDEEEETSLLDLDEEEATSILTEEKEDRREKLPNGYYLVLDKMIVHTKERI